MRALFDTGATRSVMSSRAYCRLAKDKGITRKKDNSFSIRTANGAQLRTYGTSEVNVDLNGKNFKVECVICDGLK